MKRKIGIIIAGIAVAAGMIGAGLSSESAYAETWCTYGSASKYYKYCANRVMVRFSSSSSVCKTAISSNNWDSCKDLIKSNTYFNLSGVPDSAATATKNGWANSVADVIASGKYDPCASLRDTEQYETCTKEESNVDYYRDPTLASSTTPPSSGGGGGGNDGSGGSNGSDPDPSSTKEPDANTGNCTSILTFISCDKDAKDGNGNGIVQMIKFIVSVMTGAVVIAGTVGIIICGVMMVTARDNEVQMTKARNRLIEVVIGIIAWALIAVLINFFIPQSESATDAITNPGVVIKEMRRK